MLLYCWSDSTTSSRAQCLGRGFPQQRTLRQGFKGGQPVVRRVIPEVPAVREAVSTRNLLLLCRWMSRTLRILHSCAPVPCKDARMPGCQDASLRASHSWTPQPQLLSHHLQAGHEFPASPICHLDSKATQVPAAGSQPGSCALNC